MTKKKNKFLNKNSLFLLTLFVIMGLFLFLFFNKNNKSTPIKFKNSFPQISIIPTLKINNYSSKISTKNWPSYYSQNLGVSIKYPQNWSIDEFSQNRHDFILLFDSPDVESKNTFKGGGIEISAYIDNLYSRVNTTLSPYQYIKEKSFTIPPFEETVYKQGYHALKFYIEDSQGENLLYFYIPYKNFIFKMTVRYTDKNRRQQAEGIADEMLNSLIIRE